MQGGIALCIPFAGRPVCPRWAMSLATLAYPPNLTIHYFMIEGAPVAAARQRLVELALEKKPEYLFFLDDDVIVDRMTLERLLYSLQNADPKTMVIAGIYVTKQPIPAPVAFRKNGGGPSWDWKFGEVFEVEGVGAGCMLIRAAVFEHLPKPWFQWTDQLHEQEGHHLTTGEDIFFCNRVREAGFTVLADGGVLCSHWDQTTARFYSLPSDSFPMRSEIPPQEVAPEISIVL